MVKVIYNMLLFVCTVTILLLPISYWSSQSYQQLLTSSVFYLGKDVTILIAGDSHAEASVNPDLLPHSVSIAKSAENFFFTYYKLRHFLKLNPHISCVILSCSWHNFPKIYNESYLFGDKLSSMESYFPLLDLHGKELIKSWDSSYLVPMARYSIGLPLQLYLDQILYRKLLGLSISRRDWQFYGGYRSLETTNIDRQQIIKKFARYYGGASIHSSAMSQYMLEYLHKILTLCSDRNIKVVLLNSPVHDLYRQGVPVGIIKDLDLLQLELKSKYGNVAFVDLSKQQFPTQYYYDGDHLNKRGADIVTRYIASDLAN